MALAYHVIFCAYGFWLPNDPRGSWSDFVGSWELRRFGPSTKTNERRSLARNPHNQALRKAAKNALKYPPVSFTGLQARAVARGFAEYARRREIAIWACSILPEHVHMIIAWHRLSIDSIVNQFKGYATRQLTAEQIHPLGGGKAERSCWARGQWKVFLDTQEDVERAIEYVEQNPAKEGLPRQRWTMVKAPPFSAMPKASQSQT